MNCSARSNGILQPVVSAMTKRRMHIACTTMSIAIRTHCLIGKIKEIEEGAKAICTFTLFLPGG